MLQRYVKSLTPKLSPCDLLIIYHFFAFIKIHRVCRSISTQNQLQFFQILSRSISIAFDLPIQLFINCFPGVRLPASEDRWDNGPEYTFNATIGTISNLHGDHGKYMGSSLFTALKCRPKEPDRLQCRFENTRIAKLTPDTFKAEAVIPPEDVTYSEFGFGNNTFEIKFNDKGIESYTFEQDVPNFNYFLNNMYRLVANHLSVLSRIRTVKQVEELENTTVGECFVNYKVSPKKLDNQITKKEFQLTWLPDEMMDAEQAIEMSKEVHLNNCIPHPVYRFGTRHSYGVVPVESIEKLVRGSLIN